MAENKNLEANAKEVLETNRRGDHTVPAAGLYPHQWLWDSCFIAIGLRHYDIEQAKQEVRSLLRGQWSNGMLPHIIFSESGDYYAENVWKSSRSSQAPKGVKTTGITQPPMVAEAVIRVGEKLNKIERASWYREMYQPLVDYHEWMYRERDPRGTGLVTVVHSWETGMDNTPPWMAQLAKLKRPLWIKTAKQLNLEKTFDALRKAKDGKHVPINQRLTTFDMMMVFYAAKVLARQRYDSAKVIKNNPLAIQDLAFNAILVRANSRLKEIAEELNEELPEDLMHAMSKAEHALEMLWSVEDHQYYSRIYKTGKLVREPTIANLLALYSGVLDSNRAKLLVRDLTNPETFWTRYPVPTVPVLSSYFNPERYWQGPSWVNMNWLLIDGLERNGFSKEAVLLKAKTLKTVEQAGFYEYFHPGTGKGVGVHPFSWTAALTIDLLHS